MITESKITKMFNEILEEFDHIYKKLSMLLDDIDNMIHKATDSEIKEDLEYIYSELEDLMTEIKNYCIGDCYFCYKNCDIDCSDCDTCPSLSVCIDKGKIEFLRRI
jgi:hypothetical protein